ncbi:hypothetical protein [Variovorax sp. MHTC-1]|nr:hypothetical protein EJI01_08810 [Variovorax sp. MHTC-1]
MDETRSTCPYCGVGCGHAFGGPLRGGRERRSLHLACHG